MALYHTKLLRVEAWANLQDKFEHVFVAAGAPEEMAMFAQSVPGEIEQKIAFTDAAFHAAEAFSPGGWTSVSRLDGKWSLLVGRADAAERHGVSTGHVPRDLA